MNPAKAKETIISLLILYINPSKEDTNAFTPQSNPIIIS
jgi:hypothetical protein